MLQMPQIFSNDNFHVFEGHDLELNCTLEIDLGVRAALSWELPGTSGAWEVIFCFIVNRRQSKNLPTLCYNLRKDELR